MTEDENRELVLSHLKLANQVRFARAKDKKAIRAGRLDAALILRDPPAHWKRATLVDLLLCVPKVGRVKAQKWAALERVRLDALIGALSVRQRELLARQVDFHLQDETLRLRLPHN